MRNNFPFKAFIKEASAGTGKTYSIMSEILNLIQKYGSYKILKKIVGMTFSESAAIELKERLIDKILNENYKKIRNEKEKIEIQNILLNLNFSTIHSFSRKILKRFSTFIEIDPFFKITDENESKILFSEAISEIFSEPNFLKFYYELSKNLKINRLSEIIFKMNKLHPYIFLGRPLIKNSLTEKIYEFYKNVENKYMNLKKELGYLDFNDLEKITYKVLTENPESLLILEDFDEKMDFIFVDEFQDTNLLQWEIIKKIAIEEWKSGYGAKVEESPEYGIYIVGDKKQSIYKFRGGEKEVFEEVKKELQGYYITEKLKKNHRSTKEIIDFVNSIFKSEKDWQGEELLFSEKNKDIPSKIEINLFENKEEEYEWLCNKILNLLNREDIQILDDKSKQKRKVDLKDFLILIRSRTKSFELLEEKLKDYNIPYVIIGGIGFYQEPEIKFLLSLIYSLVDSSDTLAMWNIKNSIFTIDEKTIEEYRKDMNKFEISFLIEKILCDINFWENLSTQQSANAEKFLSILQNQSHLPIYQITKNFRELSYEVIESKADIFSVHENAVKIMTIHKSKGLEAPIVFLINVEDINSGNQKDNIFYYKKEENGYVYTLKKESDKEFEYYFKEQLIEEEKRLLYVALTRARQFLFISGINKETPVLRMIKKFAEEFKGSFEKGEKLAKKETTEEEEKITFNFTPFLSFTKEKKEIRKSYFYTFVGEIVHKIIYEIGMGKFPYDMEKIKEKTKFYIYKHNEKLENLEKKILEIFEKNYKNEEIKKIIESPVSEKIKSEYPFICEINGKIYEGVIDKIFIEDEKVKIYEFKTYLENLKIYEKQLEIYKNAVERIFNKKNVECYIIDLSKSKIIRIDNKKTKL